MPDVLFIVVFVHVPSDCHTSASLFNVVLGQPYILARECVDLGKYHEIATYVRDPPPGEQPFDKRRNSKAYACVPLSKLADGNPAARTTASMK